MGRFGLAWKVFWKTWRDAQFADLVGQLAHMPTLSVDPVPTTTRKPEPAKVETVAEAPKPVVKPVVQPVAPAAGRNEALNLLAALQREARLVDFLKEDLTPYTDSQVRAAVLDVHRDAGKVVERFFAVRPLVEAEEGSVVEVPRGFQPAQYQLSGAVQGSPPFRGTLCHPGWQATKTELPAWQGTAEVAKVIAPAEVEVR